MTNFVFRKAGQSPSEISALLMAPIGTAAFNIGSPIIHSAVLIPLFMKSYIKLSDNKCNTLRSKLKSLQIILIDEISMVENNDHVYKQMISRNHRYIQAIWRTHSISIWGLIPATTCWTTKIFELPDDKFEFLSSSIWLQNFKGVELNQIMHQKDDTEFAALLNRVNCRQFMYLVISLLVLRAGYGI